MAQKRLLSRRHATQNKPNPKPAFRNWFEATAWPIPSFTPTRTVTFNGQTELNTRIASLADGDLIKYNGLGVAPISGEYTGFAGLTPATQVVFDFGNPHTSNYVQFTGPALNSHLPAVWIHDSKNLRFLGGKVSNLGKDGILINGGAAAATDRIEWWDFLIDTVGGDGLAVLPGKPAGGGSTISNCIFRGEITNWGQNPAGEDGHAEKGTGLHGCITADVVSGGQGGVTTNNTFMLWCHDGPTGAAFEMGQDTSGTPAGSITGNVLYLLAQRMTKVATSQSAGNGINLWGGISIGLTVPYLEVRDCQGRAVNGHGMYSPYTAASATTVKHARASNCNQNATQVANEPEESAGVYYATRGTAVYQDAVITIGGF